MTSSYIIIPTAALCCYLFLFLAFMAAKKTGEIKAFIMVLASCILWTGGSALMRLQAWPSLGFWFQASLLGLFMLAYWLFHFIVVFTDSDCRVMTKVWLILVLASFTFNAFTGLLLAKPVPEYAADGTVSYVYNLSWPVAVFFVVCGGIVIHTILLIFRSYREDELKKRQTKPIILGASSVLLGQLLFLAPFCKGFPIDVLSAFIMVICLGYALYKRRLFKLTLLVSKGACYAASAVLSVLFFSYWIPSMDGFMKKTLPDFPISETLMIALLFMICTVVLYNLMKICIDKLFIKDEIQRANSLKEFSHDVSQSLRINEIMDKMVRLLRDALDIQKIYVFVQNTRDLDYNMAYSLSPLDNRSFRLDHKNPLIKYLENHHECLLMSDFQCMTVYKSMWEEEKNQFTVMHTDCFIPLNDDDTLVGVVAVSLPAGKRSFSFDDLSFLSSISSICSIAVKNSRLYEQAYYEARTDELTGLYNRKYFYEILEQEYSKCEGRSLALVVFNMDDFRLYNQLYGTKEGDLALQRTARAISSCVGDNGYTTRYSSKVFSVILPGYDMLAAKNLADTIRRQIMHINDSTNDKILKVLTMSIGISSIPYTASSVSELIDTADMAVFNVKRKGKNGIMLAAGGQIMRDTQTYRNAEQEHEHREEIYSSYASTIYALTAAIDTKDHYTFNHSKNVAYYASELAYATGLDADTVEIIREAGLLHDIGKIGIPETVLNKPGKLTEEEFEIMKNHVESSVGIIRYLPSLEYVIPAVIGHHERYDGTGYPRRIAGENIPLSARILCVADSFDAMISNRSYKESYGVDFALREIEKQEGRQFDPKLASLFIQLVSSGKIKVQREEDSTAKNA
ncbi:MAG: diguanylate cyclase [Eubacteriaceae bacterium]|jgi:diguanylate cyclase (GGDEF)-like protein/putative nucleotidyltransferase with HDIG domain|nr:diguanylate cyclase [Eubacteriaceae bacterium]